MNRRNVRNRIMTVLLVAACAGPSLADARETPATADLLAAPDVAASLSVIDAWLQGLQRYERIPGLSAGVVYGDRLVWEQGYGYSNLESQRPADGDTIYSICSISKLFTSIALMQLRDAGKLSLRDPVQQHLDWFDIQDRFPERGPVRLEYLLTHSSGLPRESDFPYWNGPDFPFPTHQQIVERLRSQEMLFPPEEYFQYSNLALTLAGEVVQEASGQPYTDYIQQHILDPLQLKDTRSRYPDELRGEQLAIGYTGIHRSGTRDEVEPFFTRGITPAAGFTSTVRDLARFAAWQFRLLDEGGDSVLDANTLREMQRVHWIDPDWKQTWGLGFEVKRENDMTIVGHGGGCPGYITYFGMVPAQRMAAIVLTNAGDAPSEKAVSNVLRLFARALEHAAPASAGDAPPDLQRYEGNYEIRPWGGELAVRQWGDELVAVPLPSDDPVGSMMRLRRVDGDRFVRLDDADEAREPWVFEQFEDGSAGRISVHSIHWNRIP